MYNPARKEEKNRVFLTATSNLKHREEIFKNFQYSNRNIKYKKKM